MKIMIPFIKMLIITLTFGLLFYSCDNGSVDNNEVGEYNLSWGAFSSNYSTIKSTIVSQGWSVTEVSDGGYAMDSTATSIYNYSLNTISFVDGGASSGSFEDLLNYTNNGVGLTPNLKTALAAQKANVPLAGIFQNKFGYAVVFYVVKN